MDLSNSVGLAPTGDQPQAIEELVKGLKKGTV